MKLIKFDLPIDGIKIKNLDELRDHFTIEIIDHYRSGLLAKWLHTRGIFDKTEALKQLDTSDDRKLLEDLCHVFDIQVDDSIISTILKPSITKHEKFIEDTLANYDAFAERLDHTIYDAVRTTIIYTPGGNSLKWQQDKVFEKIYKGSPLVENNQKYICAPTNGEIIDKSFSNQINPFSQKPINWSHADIVGWFRCSGNADDYHLYSYALKSILMQRMRCMASLTEMTDTPLLKKSLADRCNLLRELIEKIPNDRSDLSEILNNLPIELQKLVHAEKTSHMQKN